MQERPEILITPKNDMSPAAPISTIGTTHGSELITHKMTAPRTTMTTAAKDPDLVYKIAFFQYFTFAFMQIYPFTLQPIE